MKKKNYFSKSIFIVVLLVGMITFGAVTFQGYKNDHSMLNLLMENQANRMSSHVMEELNEVYVLRGLVLGAKGEAVDLSTIGPTLKLCDELRNILLAPDGIVTEVYPLDGNNSVLGLNLYSTDNASSEEALKAKESGELVVTGPYELVQGGMAISGRVEVWIPTESGLKDWGLVSVTLKFPEVMQNTVISGLQENGYAYRVVKVNSETNETTELLESNFVSGKDCETVNFSIQGMEFIMDAYPIDGWINYTVLNMQVVGIIIISVLLTFGIMVVVQRRRDLQDRATKDSLTHAYNRNYGEKLITKALTSKDEYNGVFLLLDLDHFKEVNDTLGHQAGDVLLTETAYILKQSCSSDDFVCRLGGDEFVVFMPETTRDALHVKLEYIRANLERNVVKDDKSVAVTCSIGVALSPNDGTDFDTLYKNADTALYRAKNNGRNRYLFFE